MIGTIFDPKPAKTAGVAFLGFISMETLKGVMQGAILIGTCIVVVGHAAQYLIKLWCRARRKRVIYQPVESERVCAKCRLCGKALCPFGMSDREPT